ncbi:MAG: 4-(cytidine 5'-diphospho)-2-C-methyl-D-erythritol kinase [Treponema sp.]|jgi:4-diphosphocytidyl-2-C-methyl-D-erythritol kinase|nr:4-(cytidine 5'-diphospho)-2-C-methyl-D-erythritol kinase [Treponema sp.]
MLKNTQNLTVTAPAKVNIHLAVLDRRSDGFHNIESVFLAVDFADTLHFEPLKRENSVEIVMKGGSVPIPAEKNIIFRALSLFREKTGFSKGLKIRVEKRIPTGGGLGGGSSNAASALLALNKLADSPLSFDSLLEMGTELGSDVPFFLHETPSARVTGRGEKIAPLDVPDLFLTLVNPGFSSDTAAAYRLLDAKERAPAGESVLPQKLTDTPGDWPFWNDFLPVFEEPEKSVYGDIISLLLYYGAGYANLSGSGSTCFGVFRDRAKAERSAKALKNKWEFSKVCNIKKLSM